RLEPRMLSGLALAKVGPPKRSKLRWAGFCNCPTFACVFVAQKSRTALGKAHEEHLQAHAHGQLVVVRRPGRKRLELEIVCRSRSYSSAVLKKFGGHIEALPRNWMQRFARADSKPIKIGKRLIISSVEGIFVCRLSRHKGRSHIGIPASLAFGTGEH